METKAFYESKTFWANLFAIVASVAGVFNFDLSPEMQATLTTTILGVVNILLRFTTKKPMNITGS